jgi:hypothetical protein
MLVASIIRPSWSAVVCVALLLGFGLSFLVVRSAGVEGLRDLAALVDAAARLIDAAARLVHAVARLIYGDN